jgi:hypothetical protein
MPIAAVEKAATLNAIGGIEIWISGMGIFGTG